MSTEKEAVAHARLEGRVAIITGGASGIGAATVRLFSKHGAKVIIADIADEAGQKFAESLSPCATYVHCDVTKEHDVSATVDFAMENHGQLDIMFNNAGILDHSTQSIVDYDMDVFERVMNINVKGVMHGLKHAARAMIPRKKGCIISTASIVGIIGGATPHAYTASKHAVIGLTKNGAAELGKYGIRVNCVSPYGIGTDLLAQLFEKLSEEYKGKAKVDSLLNNTANLKHTTLTVDDIAEAVLYLASEEAKYVSGHNLVVDGGFTVVNHSWGLY